MGKNISFEKTNPKKSEKFLAGFFDPAQKPGFRVGKFSGPGSGFWNFLSRPALIPDIHICSLKFSNENFK